LTSNGQVGPGSQTTHFYAVFLRANRASADEVQSLLKVPIMITSKLKVGLCSIPDAAEFLSVSRGKVYSMLNAGDCPCKRFGKSVRIPWVWLHAQAEVDGSDDSEGVAR